MHQIIDNWCTPKWYNKIFYFDGSKSIDFIDHNCMELPRWREVIDINIKESLHINKYGEVSSASNCLIGTLKNSHLLKTKFINMSDVMYKMSDNQKEFIDKNSPLLMDDSPLYVVWQTTFKGNMFDFRQPSNTLQVMATTQFLVDHFRDHNALSLILSYGIIQNWDSGFTTIYDVDL
jgi:hypothetical protein